MKALRIAIITNNKSCYAWQHSIISNIKKASYADLVLHLVVEDQTTTKNTPLIWRFLKKLDSKFFDPKPYALSRLDFKDLLSNDIKKDYNSLDKDILESYKLDIVLNLSEVTLDNKLINASKYGVWFLTCCDLDKINKRPYGVWEMVDKSPESIGLLRYIHDSMSFPKTIDKTSSCTDGLSFKRNINTLLWQSHLMIADNIELLAKNETIFKSKLKNNEALFAEKDIQVPYVLPNNSKAIKYGLQLYYYKLRQLIKSKFFFNQWALIFLNNTDNGNPYKLSNYKQILPPKDRFWADPFLLKRNGKYYLFIEELIYKNKLGHLAVMEIDEDGKYTTPKEIMVKNYHLSYPFIFEDNSELYMIPETSGNNDIQLYKCTEFPLKWELEKVLMNNVIAVDTTIHKEKDTYWMFTNIKKHEGATKHVELYAFSSKKLLSNDWQPHQLNPLVRDVKTARPAGAFFIKNNKLYRPSQNCSHHYGYGLNISEIIKLNNSEFEEKIVEEIIPDWDKSVNSTHSFNSVDNLFISDIKIKRSRFF